MKQAGKQAHVKQTGQTATASEANYRGSYHEVKDSFVFWFGFFAGPLAWTVQLLLGYAFVSFVCEGSPLPYYLISGAAAALTLWAGITSFRNWRRASHGDSAVIGRHDKSVTSFMTYAGFITSIAFFALILTTGAAILLLEPCRIR